MGGSESSDSVMKRDESPDIYDEIEDPRIRYMLDFGAQRSGARVDPAEFAVFASRHNLPDKQWRRFRHLNVLNEKLCNIAYGQSKRMMIFMPPRHGKSEFVSKYFPAWYLGRFPSKRIILASYETTFANSWGAKARDVFSAHCQEIFGEKVKKGTSSKGNWGTESDGGMQCAGAGGPITGKGADILIIDDPIKNDEEANSSTYRQKLWDWWLSTASTRLEPRGSVILVQTRWHEDDLSGRILKQGGGDWDVVSLPAIAEEGDLLGRNLGDPLCPERYPLEELHKMRDDLGPYVWSSMYQQRPSPLEGGLFKRSWIKYFDQLDGQSDLYGLEGGGIISDSESYKFVTVDLAASLKTTADYTCMCVWSVTAKNELMLIDVVRERLEGPDQLKMIRDLFKKWSPVYVGIEKAGYQLTAIQALSREGLPIKELIPDKDKVSRALPATARMASGTVYFRRGAHYLVDIEDELLHFPNGRHDDFVDNLSYAVNEIQSFVMPSAI